MISSPEMTNMFGKDIFFSKAAVRSGWIQEGDEVSFSIKMESKGPAAGRVHVTSSSGGGGGEGCKGEGKGEMSGGKGDWGGCKGGGMAGGMDGGKGYGKGCGMGGCMGGGMGCGGGGWGGGGRAPKVPKPEQTYFGTVKTYAEDRG